MIPVNCMGPTCVIRLPAKYIPFPDFVEAAAQIEAAGRERNVLRYWDREQPRTEIRRDPADACRRLLEILIDNGVTTRHRARQRCPKELQAEHPHHALIDLWRASGGTLNLERDFEDIERLCKSRYLLIEKRPDQRLHFARIGRGWTIYSSRHWMSACVGRPIEEQPDYNHGLWLLANVKAGFAAGGPSLTDADALVRDPGEGVDNRWRYTRLSLPIGENQLISMTIQDRSIDLRSE